jgi:hypothetical protein
MKNSTIQDTINAWTKERDQAIEELKRIGDPTNGVPVRHIKRTKLYASDVQYRESINKALELSNFIEQANASIESLKNSRSRRSFLTEGDHVTQSQGEVDAATLTKHENLTDMGGNEPEEEEVGPSLPLEIMTQTPADLVNFFARPLKIASFNLTLGSNVNQVYNPFSLYFLDPTVRAKLRNFGFIRFTMCFRVVISGTPQHYGRLMVSFVPYPAENPAYQWYLTDGHDGNFLKYLSQFPGTRTMDVKTNQPLEWKLPFVSNLAMARLFNNSALALGASTDYDDIAPMGVVQFRTMTETRSVQAGASAPVVFIYAYLQDVVLGCISGSVSVIQTEGDYYQTEGDERETGPIENIATRVAQVAKLATNVVGIGPWASAAHMFASGVARVAAIMGWSVPTMINGPSRMKPQPFQNAVNVIGYDTGHRLTMDPKQELTVDPRVVGVVEDEMSIAYLCSVKSFLTQFTWAHTDTPMGSAIFLTHVHPRIRVPDTTYVNDVAVQPTALDMAATPFKFWRGKQKFLFQFICSQFHRGKLAIGFEPNSSQALLIDTTLDLNKQYITTVDLQETQEVEICVDWAMPRAWGLNTTDVVLENSVNTYDNAGDFFEVSNGYLFVTPITELQSPDDGDIKINVWTWSDDMLFNNLTDEYMPYSRLIHEEEKAFMMEGDPSTEETTCFELNPTGARTDHIAQLHFGELPVSFRNLIKRFDTRYFDTNTTTDTGSGWLSTALSLFPAPLPDFTNDLPVDDYPSLVAYLRLAYMAMRGGQKYRYHVHGIYEDHPMFQTKVFLYVPSPTTIVNSTTYYNGTNYRRQNFVGCAQYAPSTNAGVEFEVPMYTNNMFWWASSVYGANSTITEQNALRNVIIITDMSNKGICNVMIDQAAAEDFCLMRFLAAPPYTYPVVV